MRECDYDHCKTKAKYYLFYFLDEVPIDFQRRCEDHRISLDSMSEKYGPPIAIYKITEKNIKRSDLVNEMQKAWQKQKKQREKIMK